MNWSDIPGWFHWRSAQEEAAHRFPDESVFVEVGSYLGRSLCSLGEVARLSGKRFALIGVDTCRGSGVEGPRGKDYHGAALAEGGGTFAGQLHRNIIECGQGDAISLIVADSVTASTFFADRSIDWVHLDARHDFEHVKADIAAWLPKVKPDGWLSGDDYDETKWPEVVHAVSELLPGARPWSINQWRWELGRDPSDGRIARRESFLPAVEPPQAEKSGNVICTLGMHRSGTSLVSRLLNILGVQLGPHQLVAGSGEDNPKGYWEYRPIAQLNDEILARFGGQWDEPPAFPPSWSRDPRLEDLREKARQLLTESFAAETLWGWKDPRTCLTIPFWQDLVGSMRYVVCLRNPGAVVASLGRRNGMSVEKAERLWLSHVQSCLVHTSGKPRLFVFYEDIINDWRRELQRMAAFIGRPERADDPRVHASVDEFLERDLCHHWMSAEDLAGSEQISVAAKGLYLSLQSNAILESDLRLAILERDAQARQSEASVRVLQEIHASFAWRVVTRSRQMLVGLLPDGTRRRRVFHTALHRVAPDANGGRHTV